MRQRLLRVLVLLAIFSFTEAVAGAATFVQVGVDSNILVSGGRVSHSWTLALKLVFAAAIIGAAIAATRLCLQKRWIAGSILGVLLIGWTYLMRYPWWYS